MLAHTGCSTLTNQRGLLCGQILADLGADVVLIVTVAHPEHGTGTVEGSRFVLSRTPTRIGGSVPTLGRDNEEVLRALLGYDDETITSLVASGALE